MTTGPTEPGSPALHADSSSEPPGRPYSTGNYIQYPVINHNGKETEKECIHTRSSTQHSVVTSVGRKSTKGPMYRYI